MDTHATVWSLYNEHVLYLEGRLKLGKLSKSAAADYAPLLKIFRAAGILNVPLKDLGPHEFARVHGIIENSGRRPRTQKNLIVTIRALFNWGREMQMVEEVLYGPQFKPPSLIDIEAEQEEVSACRFLEAEAIRAMLEVAESHLKVAILLGINCGFYQSDSVALQFKHLHNEGDIVYHNFRRVKNKRPRMAVLWPEVVEEIEEHHGFSLELLQTSSIHVLKAGGMPARRLQLEFNRLANKVGEKSKGVGIGSLRHTYATVIDTVPDQTMIDLTMGHVARSLQKRTYKQVNIDELERLKKVAGVARKWLLT